jgi:predicted RNase H-like HicB family nuclease
MMIFSVIYERDDVTGWSGFVPDLPGVGVAGDTIDEVRELMPKAIEMHLRGMREDGLPIPTPTNMVLGAIAVATL